MTVHVRVGSLLFFQAGNNWQCGSARQTQEVILGLMPFCFVLFHVFILVHSPYPIIRYYLSAKKEKEKQILVRNTKRK